MFTNVSVLNDAQAMARHAAARQTLVAENIANVDTPGYKARDITSFQDIMANKAPQMRMTASRSSHLSGTTSGADYQPFADKNVEASPDGNTVAVETEMLKSIEAERQHSRAITIYQTSMNILRASIGRGR